MRQLLLPVAALLFSQALLLIGHGLQLTLLPIRAEIEQFTEFQIAMTGSSYFLGFVAGCLLTPLLVRRAGHIRSFAALASLFSALVPVFHVFPHYALWLALRVMVGFCISGLYMIIESWLTERASRETRGTLLSIYTVINLSMIMVGQQLLNLAEPETGDLFALAAVLLSLAIIPVSMTLTLAPAPLTTVKLDLRRAWFLSRVGTAGAFAAGLTTGAFWSLGPVYANGVGLSTPQLTLFMSAAVLGGALFQLPFGRLSDYYDRRLVILFLSVFGAAISALLTWVHSAGNLLLVFSLLWGATVMTLYAICLAQVTDHADPDEFVVVGGGILLLFGFSSALGGPLASVFIQLLGAQGLFAFCAVCLVAFAVGIFRRRQTHVVPLVDETEPFRLVSDTATTVAMEMDPRSEEGHLSEYEPEDEEQPDNEQQGA